MIRNFGLAIILTCSVALFASDQIASKVDQILAEANIHQPRVVAKALAKLGKPAVPYLIEKLNTYKHPILIVEGLRKIGDKDAVLPLIAFLKKHNLSEKQDILLNKAILKTLGVLQDPRPENSLLEILRNEKNLTEIRLYAAISLVKIGSPESKKEASAFIMTSPLLAPGQISPVDLDTAYFELGTKEAMDRLAEALQRGLGYEQLFIVDLLAERINPQVNEILLRVLENKQYFPEVRKRAAEALVKRKDIPKERLLNALYSLQEESNVQHWIDKVQRTSKQ